MKRIIALLLLILILLPFNSQAASPGFVIMDPTRNTAEFFGSDNQPITTLKTGSHPSNLIKTPDGYLLMFQGDSLAAPGGLTFLNQTFKPTGKQIIFNGKIIQNYYLPAMRRWILNTVSGDKKQTEVTANIVDLNDSSNFTVLLNSKVSVFGFDPNSKQLAFATTGSSKLNLTPQLMLIDLDQHSSKTFPLSLNPGAIFFAGNGKVMVACGGYRRTQRYPDGIILERSAQPIPASLHWIDFNNDKTETIPVEYSPLAIVQDQNSPDLFYLASTNSKENSSTEENSFLSNIFNSPETDEPSRPAGIFRQVKDGKVIATTKIFAEPVSLTQAKNGMICILGREVFILIDPSTSKVLNQINYKLRTDQLLIDPTGTVGYLSLANSIYVDKIDLDTGQLISKFKIVKSGAGSFQLSNLFNTPLAPVTSPNLNDYQITRGLSANSRMFFAPDQSLFILANDAVVANIDPVNGQVKTSLAFSGYRSNGIHPTPNLKFIVVPSETYWSLLSPGQKKPVLDVSLSKDENVPAPQSGYYSPDGSLLIIPFNYHLYLIDTEQGRLIKTIKTKIPNPLIAWL